MIGARQRNATLTGMLLTNMLAAGPLSADTAESQDVPPRPYEIIRLDLDESYPDEEEETGWHGHIMLGVEIVSGRSSGLEYDKKKRNISSLGDPADRTTQTEPLIMGSLGYTFTTGTTIWADVEPALYIDQSLGDSGEISVGISASRSDVWKDPYLIGIDRERTHMMQTRLCAEYSIAGLSVGGGVTSQKIKDDDIGNRFNELMRNGKIYDLDVGFTVPTEDFGIFQTFLGHKREVLDGKADSSHGYSANILHNFMVGDIAFVTGFSYRKTRYDAINPLLNVKRKDTEHGLSETVIYGNLFGNPNLHAILTLTWEATDSNHDFFESRFFTSGLGLGYAF